MRKEYISLLKDLNHALGYLSLADLTDVDEQIIKVIVAERLELESRKDKLIVGSEWEIIIGCFGKHHSWYTGQKMKITGVSELFVGIDDTDFIPIGQFLLCAKPKEETE